MGMLAAPRPVAVIRPPDVSDLAGTTVSVLRVWPGSPAERAGLREGDAIQTLPQEPADVLRLWCDAQRQRPGDAVPLSVTRSNPSDATFGASPQELWSDATFGASPQRR